VTRFAAIALLATGCFYTDPINQRPSADIIQNTSGPLYRNATVSLDASTDDPEGEQVEVKWRAYACTDATTPAGCDEAPFFTGFSPHADIQVPITRDDQTTPVEALRVILEAIDGRGATAKPAQELLLAVTDHPPVLTLRQQPRHQYVVGTAVDLYAQISDPHDVFDAVAVKPWDVFSPPTQPKAMLIDMGALSTDPSQLWQVFTPPLDGAGDWMVRVTATDPVGAQDVEDFTMHIVPDHAPCLAQWSPAAPPTGATLPMQDPTPFQVLVVNDDLDAYPPVTGDAVLGVPTFSWSLLPPGGSVRQPLAIAGNRVELDPASYQPGDVLELRVEIEDRNHTPVACPDSDPTCSVISDPQCTQRLTWRVEVQ
jgi:hypothetical protein